MSKGRVSIEVDIQAQASGLMKTLDALSTKTRNLGKDSKFGKNLSVQIDEAKSSLNAMMEKTSGGFFNSSDVKSVQKDLSSVERIINSITKKIKTAPNENLISSEDLNKIKNAEDAIQKLKRSLTNVSNIQLKLDTAKGDGSSEKSISNLTTKLEAAQREVKAATDNINESFSQLGMDVKDIPSTNIESLSRELNTISADKATSEIKSLNSTIESVTGNVHQIGSAFTTAFSKTSELERSQRDFDNIKMSLENVFSIQNTLELFKRGVREAFETVKDLDKAMTETAVVTDFSVGDMWNKLPQYTAMANNLGVTIQDVYEASTLYYQQGLKTNEAMAMTNETLKMARIAGMDASEATDMMTAAVRGFNLAINDTSAKKVNDVYSELAAITASDTKEIGTAMTKTASIAHSAGMDIETTATYLAKAIEATREAPENIGTAMKTIIARFQEIKSNPLKEFSDDAGSYSYNKIDAALQTIGIQIKKVNGDFKDAGTVFNEIGSKWDGLSQSQQRYIATTAAGSRQQSRFIAMMDNYGRTQELLDAAYNSNGASQRQFGKTLESMETKLNRLKNAFDQFLMGIANNTILKGSVDLLTNIIEVIDKIIDGVSGLTGPLKGVTKSILEIGVAWTALSKGGSLIQGGMEVLTDQFMNRKIAKSVRSGKIDLGSYASKHSWSEEQTTRVRVIVDQNVSGLDRLKQRIKDKLNISSGFNTNLAKAFSPSELEKVAPEIKNLGKTLKTQFKNSIKAADFTDALKQSGGFNLSDSELSKVLNSSDVLKKTISNSLHSIANDSNADEAGRKIASQIADGLDQGTIEVTDALKTMQKTTNKAINGIEIKPSAMKGMSNEMLQKMGTGVSKVGMAFQDLGNIISQVPGLSRIGNQISNIGMLLTSLAGIIDLVGYAIKTKIIGQLKRLATANPILTAVIIAAMVTIGALVHQFQKLQNRVKNMNKVIDTFKNKVSKADNNITKLQGWSQTFNQLAEGVDSAGRNIGLTSSQFEKYNKIANKIAKMNPTLVKGYTAEGNAILDQNKAISESIKLQEQKKRKAQAKYLSVDKGNTIIQGTQKSIEDTSIKRYEKQLKEIKKYTGGSSSNSQYSYGGLLSQMGYGDGATISSYAKMYRNSGDIVAKATKQYNLSNKEVAKLKNSLDGLAGAQTDYELAIQPKVDWLDTYANYVNNKGKSLVNTLPKSIQEGYTEGLKNIAENGTDAAQMQQDAQKLQKQLSAAYSGADKNLSKFDEKGKGLASTLANLAVAQEKYNNSSKSDDDVKAYNDSVKKTVKNLEDMADAEEAAGNTDLAASLRAQADNARDYANNIRSLAEAFNPLAGQISSANNALTAFQNATKEDYYTGVNNMKQIMETTLSSENTAGRGSMTFWTGVKELVSDDVFQKFNYNVSAAQAKVKELQKSMVTDQGSANTFIDKISSLNLKGVGWNSDHTVFKVDPSQFETLADSLGVSSDYLMSMLKSAQQFVNLDWTDTATIIKAIKSDSNTQKIKGKYYVNEDELKSQYIASGGNEQNWSNVLTEIRKNKSVKILNWKDQPDIKVSLESLNVKKDSNGQYNKYEATKRMASLGMSDTEILSALRKLYGANDKSLEKFEHNGGKKGYSAAITAGVKEGGTTEQKTSNAVSNIDKTTQQIEKNTSKKKHKTKTDKRNNKTSPLGLSRSIKKGNYTKDPARMKTKAETDKRNDKTSPLGLSRSIKKGDYTKDPGRMKTKNSPVGIDYKINSQELPKQKDALMDYLKKLQEDPDKKQALMDYLKQAQEDPDKKQALIDYLKQNQVPPDDAEAFADYLLGEQPKNGDLNALSSHANYSMGKHPTSAPTISGKVNLVVGQIIGLGAALARKLKGKAVGQNNHYSTNPSFPSYAAGKSAKNKKTENLALTGELGPEIVWEPNSGWYIVGSNGPELANIPSDAVVYTNAQSKKIAKQRKHIPSSSFASGTSDKWENPYLRSYNANTRIEFYNKTLDKLYKSFEKFTKNYDNTAKYSTLKSNYDDQVNNLALLRANAQNAKDHASQERLDAIAKFGRGSTAYVTYDVAKNLLTINYSKIAKITKSTVGEKVSTLVSAFDNIKGDVESANETLQSVEEKLEELRTKGRDELSDVYQDIYDGIKNVSEDQKDSLQSVSDSIEKYTSKTYDALKQSIDDARQARENDKTKQDISDKRSRLAMLQQDTSGGHAVEIASLKKEIQDAEESFQDSLVDQLLDDISKQNDKAQQQREDQISLLETQVQIQEDTKALWEQAYNLYGNTMGEGLINADGTINEASAAFQAILKSKDYDSKNKAEQVKILEEVREAITSSLLYKTSNYGSIADRTKKGNTQLGGLEKGSKVTINVNGQSQTATVLDDAGKYIGINQGASSTGNSAYNSYDRISTDQFTQNNNGSYDFTGDKLKTTHVDTGESALNTARSEIAAFAAKVVNASAQTDVRSYNVYNKTRRLTSLEKAMWAKFHNSKNGIIMWQYIHRNRRISDDSANKIFNKYGLGRSTFLNLFDRNGGKLALNQQRLAKLKIPKYATGGKVTATGPAWLDGTASKPEAVLNASDTANFYKLVEALSAMNSKNSSINSGTVGDTYINVDINVDNISKDYDVDKLADRVTKKISESANYRNVVSVKTMK